MSQTARHVVSSKPAAGGAVWSAPLGTKVPQDATTALDQAFTALGYISEDGVKENGSISVTTIKAYGGATVLAIEGGNDVTYTFTPIEYDNPVVQRELYGQDNVAVDDSGALKSVKMADIQHPERVYVFEHVLSNGVIEREVLPCAQVTGIGTNTHSSTAALGPEVTLTPYPDAAGFKGYKYFAEAVATGRADASPAKDAK